MEGIGEDGLVKRTYRAGVIGTSGGVRQRALWLDGVKKVPNERGMIIL